MISGPRPPPGAATATEGMMLPPETPTRLQPDSGLIQTRQANGADRTFLHSG